jgi:hypothetical protein
MRLKEAKSVAVGCDQSPNGKEEVDGSSPSGGGRRAANERMLAVAENVAR